MRNGPIVLKDYRAESRTARFVFDRHSCLSISQGQTRTSVLLLCCKRSSATAAASRVWIRKRETRSHHARDVIDLDAVEILAAKHVDKKFDAFLIENEIALA